MRDFAAGLGFDFEPAWALMFPLEKILAYVDEEAQDYPQTDEDHVLIDHLALPLNETLAYAKKCHSQPCSLRDSQISMDFQGNVMLCCGIFDSGKYTIGHYMDMTLDEIQRIRQSHGMCGNCMRQGAHVYLTYRIPEMDELLLETIAPEDVNLLNLRNEVAQKRIQQRLQRVYQKIFSGIITKTQKTALKTLINRIQHFLAG